MININSKAYWDKRFEGDWEKKSGRQQTTNFARTQIQYFEIPSSFTGKILDFGCGLGDAMPVYRQAYPNAQLIGQDISDEAIKKCKERYGDISEFIAGDYHQTPDVDIIIASNVFEHLSNHITIAAELLKRCKHLYIIVPYRETLTAGSEHVNSYTEQTFKSIGDCTYKVFHSKGWTQEGTDLWINVYAKNLLRPFFGKKIISRHKQIMFHFRSPQ